LLCAICRTDLLIAQKQQLNYHNYAKAAITTTTTKDYSNLVQTKCGDFPIKINNFVKSISTPKVGRGKDHKAFYLPLRV